MTNPDSHLLAGLESILATGGTDARAWELRRIAKRAIKRSQRIPTGLMPDGKPPEYHPQRPGPMTTEHP